MDRNPQRKAAFLRHFGRHILLVEGSRMYSTALRFRLEAELGVLVTHCADMAGLRMVLADAQKDFALAIVDPHLPGAREFQALDAMLSRDIPSILFSACSGEDARAAALTERVIDHVVKDSPSVIQQAVVCVDRVLSSVHTKVLLHGRAAMGCTEGLIRQQRFQLVTAVDDTAVLGLLDVLRDIDIVVIDLDRLQLQGLLLLSEIRRRYTDMSVRVIGISEKTDDMTMLRFLRAGGDEFIGKPVCAEEFVCRLRYLASMHKRMQTLDLLASRDYLTGLYNRRYFFEDGKRLVDQAVRRGARASIAILDIDHFKRLNDTYGHEVGDIVLKTVASRLRSRLGTRHLLARLGGEEFGILFEGLELADTVACCEGLRRELAAAPIEADGEPVTITVSVGAAAIEGHEAFDNHLNAADQFLYMAKHSGRNRVFSELSLPRVMAG